MIIHSYLTDGFYGWAELFIESYRFYHGNNDKIFLSTRNLNESQIKKLESYPNTHVSNKKLKLKKIANRAKMDVDELLKLKHHIENDAVTNKTFIWKQAISVEDRYRRSILEAMTTYPNEDYLIHFDIDMYFRERLIDLFKTIKQNDITIKFRLDSKLNRKVMGGLIGFKISEKTLKFMNRWVYHIDAKPLHKKPVGYGQTSFYLAYIELKEQMTWGHVNSRYISPRFLETDAIWSGNTKAGKAKNLMTCYKDFKRRRKT
ncbi:MAG: hypothetical protein K9L62_10360 [Vallitaleaceae bacterium]|nr:hypothetical protein [Vallitaleaceae bacterium]